MIMKTGRRGSVVKALVYLRAYFPEAGSIFEQVKRLREPAQVKEALLQAISATAGAEETAAAA